MSLKKLGLMLMILCFVFIGIEAYSATISFMSGDVKVIRDGKTIKAQFQMALQPGDMVAAGKNAFADISYDDGTVIKIQQNSSVKIGSKSANDSSSISVTSGTVSGKFAKLAKDSGSRKVYTPTTVCAVRGTEFTIAVSDGADSRVQMKEGSLDVYNPFGETKLEGTQSAEVGVASTPAKEEAVSLEDWNKQKTAELDKQPQEKSGMFEMYMQTFSQRSQNASGDIEKLNKQQSTMKPDNVEKTGQEVDKVGNNVQDDLLLNEAANSSLDGIISRFKKNKNEIYGSFQKVKEESNKVLAQQQKNYAAIQAVREAYNKAKEEILGKHKSYTDQIKGGINKDQYKLKK